MLFKPLRVFIPLALVCLLYGLTKMSIDMWRDPNISASAILALISAMQLTLVGMLGEAIASRLGRLNPQTAYGVRPKEMFEMEETEDVGRSSTTAQKAVLYSVAKN
jgi:hypothetical protein